MTDKDLQDREAKLKADQAALDQQRTDLAAADAAAKAEFAERENKIKGAEIAARRKETAEFVAGLVATGKLLPRDQAGMVAYMSGPNEHGVIEFGEGETKASKLASDWLREFLTGLPPQVDYKEHSAGKVIEALTDPKVIADKAIEYQEAERKAGRTVTVTAAVTHVTAQAAK